MTTLLERKRMGARMTIRDLAERSRVPARTIRELESGRVASPRDETLFPLADALDVDPVALKNDFAGTSRTTEAVA